MSFDALPRRRTNAQFERAVSETIERNRAKLMANGWSHAQVVAGCRWVVAHLEADRIADELGANTGGIAGGILLAAQARAKEADEEAQWLGLPSWSEIRAGLNEDQARKGLPPQRDGSPSRSDDGPAAARRWPGRCVSFDEPW